MGVPETLESHKPAEVTSNLAVVYFLMQGCGTLISWNAILNGLDYFDTMFPKRDAFFSLPIAVFFAQAIANIGMLKISQVLSVNSRIYGSLIGLGVLLAILPIITDMLQGTAKGFWTIMGLLFFVGFCSTVYQSTLSGLCSFFPWKYMSLFLVGSGLAGLIMNALRSIAILSFGGDKGTDTFQIIFYFVIAAFIMIICMFVHLAFTKTDFYKAHAKLVKTEEAPETDTLTYDGENGRNAHLINDTEERPPLTMYQVFQQCKFFVFILLVNYVQTFTFFPGIMLEKETPQFPFHWKLVFMITMFNIFDVIGKSMAERPKFCKKNIVSVMTAFRFIFAVTFMWQAATNSFPIISSVGFGFINIAFFGFTNGFVTTASFILGPSEVEGKSKEVAGFLSVIGLTSGITIGTFVALAAAKLLSWIKTL